MVWLLANFLQCQISSKNLSVQDGLKTSLNPRTHSHTRQGEQEKKKKTTMKLRRRRLNFNVGAPFFVFQEDSPPPPHITRNNTIIQQLEDRRQRVAWHWAKGTHRERKTEGKKKGYYLISFVYSLYKDAVRATRRKKRKKAIIFLFSEIASKKFSNKKKIISE